MLEQKTVEWSVVSLEWIIPDPDPAATFKSSGSDPF